MKKKAKRILCLVLVVAVLVGCFSLGGCQCKHEWTTATCTTPKTCSKCGVTEGEELKHEWTTATCTTPKTCSRCGVTEGNELGHSFVKGVCTVCDYHSPVFDELAIAEEAYLLLLLARAGVDYVAEKIQKAWSFGIYDADDYYTASKIIAAFSRKTGIKESVISAAINEFLADIGMTSTDITRTSALGSFSTCVAVMGYAMAEMIDANKSTIQQAKEKINSLSREYDSETGYSILVEYYGVLGDYYNWTVSPSGSYSTISSTISSFRAKCSQYENALSFLYDLGD